MPGLLEAIKHNPLFFLDALLATLGGLLAAWVGWVLVGRRSPSALSAGVAAMILGGVAVAAGMLGYVSTRQSVGQLLKTPGLTGADIARLQAANKIEAFYVLALSLLLGLFPLVLGGIVARRAPRQPEAR